MIWSKLNEEGLLIVETVLIDQSDYDALPQDQKKLVGVPVAHTVNGDVYPRPDDGWKLQGNT